MGNNYAYSHTKTAVLAIIAASAFAGAGTAAATTTTITAEDISWYGYRSNSTVSFSYDSTTGTTTVSNLDDTSYVWGYLPESITLNVGDTVTLSATITFTSVTSDGVFYFGLYNCGANTEPESSSVSYTSITEATYDMTGFFAGTKNSTTTVYSRFSGKEGAGFMTTNQGKSYIASAALDTALDAPTADTAYDFVLSITRTDEGYSISLGTDEVVTFSTDESFSANSIDLIAFKSTGNGFSLSNLLITVVPEPATFSLFAGIVAVALAATRRRYRARR